MTSATAASGGCAFVTGGTGYVGSALIPAHLAQGYVVIALVRPGSAARLPPGVAIVTGDALDAESYAAAIPPRRRARAAVRATAGFLCDACRRGAARPRDAPADDRNATRRDRSSTGRRIVSVPEIRRGP